MSDKTEPVSVGLEPGLLDKEGAAQFLGRVSEYKVDELLKAGRLTAKRIDKRVVFEVAELRRFIADLPNWEPKAS